MWNGTSRAQTRPVQIRSTRQMFDSFSGELFEAKDLCVYRYYCNDLTKADYLLKYKKDKPVSHLLNNGLNTSSNKHVINKFTLKQYLAANKRVNVDIV
jgi:hypothetical protein